MSDLTHLLNRVDQLLERIEQYFPQPPAQPDWASVAAFRWRTVQQRGYFHPVHHPHQIRLHDLQDIEPQKAACVRNTRQFLAGKPANNILLWGSRGTGKSSLIKALLNEYATQGLRLIEVEKYDLIDLPTIVDGVYDRPEHFIIFCDDLSFEQDDARYKALKSMLDGSVSASPSNVLIYATSNRRHLLPEYRQENLAAQSIEGEIHHAEAVEEKISLSERFGLWLSFYPFKQDQYLAIVEYWLAQLAVNQSDHAAMQQAALQWALLRGSRSGRTAWQFAQDWAGRHALDVTE